MQNSTVVPALMSTNLRLLLQHHDSHCGPTPRQFEGCCQADNTAANYNDVFVSQSQIPFGKFLVMIIRLAAWVKRPVILPGVLVTRFSLESMR